MASALPACHTDRGESAQRPEFEKGRGWTSGSKASANRKSNSKAILLQAQGNIGKLDSISSCPLASLLTSTLVNSGLPPTVSFCSQNLPEAPCPQLWIPHWPPTQASAAQARHWPARGPAHRGWGRAGGKRSESGPTRAPGWEDRSTEQCLDAPGLELGGLLGFSSLQGRAGLWRAHRPGVLSILDEVPGIEKLILHRFQGTQSQGSDLLLHASTQPL